MWDVKQTEEFQLWFEDLDAAAKEDIFASVRVLSEIGPSLGRPRVDTIKLSRHKNMKELRVQSRGRPFRIMFAFDPSRSAILLIGGNKQGNKRFYELIISLAYRLYDRYLRISFKLKKKHRSIPNSFPQPEKL